MRTRIAGMLLLMLIVGVSDVSAQSIEVPGIANSVILNVSPQYPSPGQTVHITAESPIVDLATADISWSEGSKQLPGGLGATSIDVTAGPLGTRLDIVARIETSEGIAITSSTSLIPTQIDLLYDGDTYSPPFYRGRALPSAGSVLELHALPWFRAPNGSFIDSKDLIFTWKQGGSIVAAASGKGKNTARITLASFASAGNITVIAASSDRKLVGETQVQIPIAEPILDLYQEHPLFGILAHAALGSSATIEDTQATLAAVPYFAPTRSLTDPGLTFEWMVDGVPVPETQGNNQITIEPKTRKATVSVSLSHNDSIYFGVSGLWNIALQEKSLIQTNAFAPKP